MNNQIDEAYDRGYIDAMKTVRKLANNITLDGIVPPADFSKFLARWCQTEIDLAESAIHDRRVMP